MLILYRPDNQTWHSSEVKKRIGLRTVMTKSGTVYVLVGKPSNTPHPGLDKGQLLNISFCFCIIYIFVILNMGTRIVMTSSDYS